MPAAPRASGGTRVARRRRASTRPRGRGAANTEPRAWRALAWSLLEAVALLAVALTLVLAALGAVADRFVGTGLWSVLLPFAATVLVVGGLVGTAVAGWIRIRGRIATHAAWLPAAIASAGAVAALLYASRPAFRAQVDGLRQLTGGSPEAQRVTLAHQVFAAYRRADLAGLTRILERSRVYEPTVREAATAFGVDAEVLMGVASAESSFDPRDSRDGGHGLFQLTAPPAEAVAEAKRALGATELDPRNQRHNAFVAAATLRRYLADMRGDPFLALLAYNIGPRNGGLRTIMQQYGATDFVTVQPYLQNLPRDYPVRVLLGALAYRVWRHEGRLLRYEDGPNARRIQALGVPLLDAPAS